MPMIFSLHVEYKVGIVFECILAEVVQPVLRLHRLVAVNTHVTTYPHKFYASVVDKYVVDGMLYFYGDRTFRSFITNAL